MHIIHVYVHVMPDQIEAFKAATIENADKSTRNESGCARFDVVQQADDPTRFVLIEIYRTREDAAKHKETKHYNHWRELAEPLLVEPRTRMIYTNLFPGDLGF
jgi:quinol monooxygenase YgiN